jgi:hypothetical protein
MSVHDDDYYMEFVKGSDPKWHERVSLEHNARGELAGVTERPTGEPEPVEIAADDWEPLPEFSLEERVAAVEANLAPIPQPLGHRLPCSCIHLGGKG